MLISSCCLIYDLVVSEAPLQCPLNGRPVFLKDRSREIRRELERERSQKYRMKLNRAASMRKRRPKKKKKDMEPAPGRWETLPMQLPYSLLRAMVRGNLMEHLNLINQTCRAVFLVTCCERFPIRHCGFIFNFVNHVLSFEGGDDRLAGLVGSCQI